MKKFILFLLLVTSSFVSQSQIVSGIAAVYHDGQVFITWKNLDVADSGFYYVYKNSVPITEENFQSSTYLGRVVFNSAFDYRFTYALRSASKKYFVINDNPKVKLSSTQGFFVMNCTQAGVNDYFAVRCDYGKTTANWHVTADSNSTSSAVTEQLDPVKCYLEDYVKAGGANDSMKVYVHYGSNVATNGYPEMGNEGCLSFHFGIITTGAGAQGNAMFVKFHGGQGDFITNCITATLANSWKVSFDDWIPAYKFDTTGANTRWLGYTEHLDIYNYDKNTPPPTTGIIKCYAFHRVTWELQWMKKTFGNALDTTRIYLNGSSLGCGGVFTHCLIEPGQFAAGTATDGKFNMAASEDDNPNCKFNEGNGGRNDSRVMWGNEDSVNLLTDVLIPGSTSSYFGIYDITNMNYMFNLNANNSIPFMYTVNGKNDDNTCWEEKIGVFNTIQANNEAGIYEWDLRGHSGGATSWPSVKLAGLFRYNIFQSYPAFSNGTLDGNPGLSVNPDSPYYSGDDIGSLHANYDWDPASVKDSSNSWQADIFIKQDTMNNDSLVPATLSSNSKATITIARAQNFKGFANKQVLYWINIHKGDTVQNGTVKQKFLNGKPKLISVKKVKTYKSGNTFRIQTTPFLRVSPHVMPPAVIASVYPNPFGNQFNIRFNLQHSGSVTVIVFNLLGEELIRNEFFADEGQNSLELNTTTLQHGTYLVQVITPDGGAVMKGEKD